MPRGVIEAAGLLDEEAQDRGVEIEAAPPGFNRPGAVPLPRPQPFIKPNAEVLDEEEDEEKEFDNQPPVVRQQPPPRPIRPGMVDPEMRRPMPPRPAPPRRPEPVLDPVARQGLSPQGGVNRHERRAAVARGREPEVEVKEANWIELIRAIFTGKKENVRIGEALGWGVVLAIMVAAWAFCCWGWILSVSNWGFFHVSSNDFWQFIGHDTGTFIGLGIAYIAITKLEIELWPRKLAEKHKGWPFLFGCFFWLLVSGTDFGGIWDTAVGMVDQVRFRLFVFDMNFKEWANLKNGADLTIFGVKIALATAGTFFVERGIIYAAKSLLEAAGVYVKNGKASKPARRAAAEAVVAGGPPVPPVPARARVMNGLNRFRQNFN